MLNLKNEYIDTKNIKHQVVHLAASDMDDSSRERIVEELFFALTRPIRPDKRVPT